MCVQVNSRVMHIGVLHYDHSIQFSQLQWCFCRQDVGRRTEGDDQPHGFSDFSGVWMGHPYFTVVVIGEVTREVLPWILQDSQGVSFGPPKCPVAWIPWAVVPLKIMPGLYNLSSRSFFCTVIYCNIVHNCVILYIHTLAS